jgi:hypothetical protein
VVHLEGFKRRAPAAHVTVGSAFEMPMTLTGRRHRRARHGDGGSQTCSSSRAARSPGTVSEAEAQHLPMNGRNFLDLALLVPGVSPTNVGSTQLVRRNVGGARRRPVGRQPAQLLEQLHRRRPVGERRCGGLSGMPYGVDAVEQFQVVTSGGQAELGRALAATSTW